MNCEICGHDIGEIVVSLPLKTADGCLNTMACLKCAEDSSVYCKKHQRPHLGFIENTTACMECIEEMVAENRHQETHIFYALLHKIPREEYERLLKWAGVSSSITHDSQKTCILRVVATKAKRNNQTIEEVLEKIIETKSIECILPLEIYP